MTHLQGWAQGLGEAESGVTMEQTLGICNHCSKSYEHIGKEAEAKTEANE